MRVPILISVSIVLMMVFVGCDDDDDLVSPACSAFESGASAAEILDGKTGYCAEDAAAGNYGRWERDSRGLPAFAYELDQYSSPLGNYYNTEGDDRSDQWHGFGNDRITALAHNSGEIEFFYYDRGYKYLNKIDEETDNHGGGYGYIDDGGDVYGQIYQPEKFDYFRRRFTLGGFEIESERNGLAYRRSSWAPYGDEPVIESEITLTNYGATEKTFTYYEFWDLNIWQMIVAPVGSDMMASGAIAATRKKNREFNDNFLSDCFADEQAGVVGCSFESTAADIPGFDEINMHDYYYPAVWLTLDGLAPDYLITDSASFFDGGEGDAPAGLDRAAGVIYQGAASGMPQALALGKQITLPAGGSISFKSIFGLTPPDSDKTPTADAAEQAGAERSFAADGEIRQSAADIAWGPENWASRELAWHADGLITLTGYEQLYENHTVMQGSAYMWIQGAQGAVRDISLFTIPMIPLRPDIAKQMIQYCYRMTEKNGQINYATTGLRMVGGLGVHNEPSDLDIFLLWMSSEYLLATRDFASLDEPAPFFPDSQTTATALDHILTALDHLEHHIGLGENGLIRISDGDWNDGIIRFSEDAEETTTKGESGFNTAFACYVMPRLSAAFFAAGLGEHAVRAGEFGDKVCAGLKSAFNGKWFLRGYTAPDVPFGDDRPWLEPQVFALLSPEVPDEMKTKLVENIKTELDDPSPIGALIVNPAYENPIWPVGWDVNGGVWAALTGLLTWAYAAIDPELSLRQFTKSSLKNHAEVYPNLWYGIWTGPDSYNAHYAERPGEAFYHLATAMTDFPAMNGNQNALPLLAAIKSLGWNPVEEGIEIRPLWNQYPFRVKLKLAGWAYTRNTAAFYYNPVVDSEFTLRLALPPDHSDKNATVTVNGGPAEYIVVSRFAVINLTAKKGERLTIELR